MAEDTPHPRLCVCLTFDFDAMSLWVRSSSASMVSRGEFGAVAIDRILRLLSRAEIASTFFVPGHTALAFPDLVRRIRDDGHEIGHHGWVHENPASLEPDAERFVLERGLEALDDVTGVRPSGYRAPAWDMSRHSIDLLLEYGFDYDSSFMADDFSPYYLRRGDRWSPDGPYVFGEPSPLVEVPVSWGLDDYPPFEYVPGRNPGLSAPSAVQEIWQGDFDWALAHCRGGVFTLTLHPQVIGRGHRMLMLKRLVDHMRAADGVRFETVRSYAVRWRKDHPLEEWKVSQPVHAPGAVRSDGPAPGAPSPSRR